MSDVFSVRSRLRNYDVDFVDDFMVELKRQASINTFLMIDSNVYRINKNRLEPLLDRSRYLLIDAAEENKTLDYSKETIAKLLEMRIKKQDVLIAIGGGIVQDVTAFISSILFRGIDWYFYPTTLLAQGDSCIGSKTSINLCGYKNILGSFYPPVAVFIDASFLKTLAYENIKSGIGEMLHYFLIAASKQAENLMQDYEKLMESPQLFKKYILESLKIKRKTIEIDELDRKERNIFNYGHTFGHAIETVSKFRVNHGQAVTMGMDIANYISLNYGCIDEDDFKYFHKILTKNMPNFHLQKEDIEIFFDALSKDKKNIDKNLTCILTNGHRTMQKTSIPLDEKFRNVIRSYFKIAV